MNQRMGELFMGMEYETAKAVMEEVARVVTGKDDCIKKAYAAILAGGHILIEDVPGVGKLEVMEEGKVTVDGVSREVPKPFIVMATQNPKGSAGTQLLPESQLDRFMICMSMGYPDVKSEIAIARGRSSSANMVELQPVIGAQELEALCGIVENDYKNKTNYTKIITQKIKTP